MKKKSHAQGPGEIDLLEEAVHLLRDVPAGLYGVYALGALPFILFFLFFWADMSRGAFASEHAARAAVTMGLLFLWMKCWQAVFADGLRARLSGRPSAPWTARRAGRLALTQTALQPFALFAVPLAFLIILPFGWTFSFYQNLTVLGGESRGLADSCRAAARQSSTRTGQGLILLALLFVFVLFVWLNVVVGMGWLPHLMKTFFGVETAFTEAGWKSVLNTTYLACSVALAYLCVDPLVKAIFVLRCFYGQSLQSGEDLKSELARVRRTASALPAAMVGLFLFGSQLTAAPASPSFAGQGGPAVAVTPAQLDQSINQVLQRPEFAWRMPREKPIETKAGRSNWFTRMVDGFVGILEDAFKYCYQSLVKLAKWFWDQIRNLFPNPHSEEAKSGSGFSGWESALRIMLVILIVGIAAALAVLLMRWWRQRRRPQMVEARAILAKPDLNDENVAADQLPEDDWLRLARELMAQGNLRLALRALYLAGLAHLAAREMITLAVFKSNRDYERELLRRARALPAVQNAFSQNVAIFDRVWYGLREVSQEGVEQFQSNLERIRAC